MSNVCVFKNPTGNSLGVVQQDSKLLLFCFSDLQRINSYVIKVYLRNTYLSPIAQSSPVSGSIPTLTDVASFGATVYESRP